MTRGDCISAAAAAWAGICVRDAQRTPREAAEAAHQPGGPSVDDLERAIRSWRARQRRPLAA